ncbi:hypothetical protein [Stakelama tenebrarum]|uniref:Uncharacterized protein n=1 Tax=Stakelama tenebrarum TaxID=2711215 RepID=A0A6G6Y9I6_9SPHN|nr:hypothetical protein [Sphingosinithalassobacter tenebrarum]QIG81595.1 hypothetical protein G5C33_18585 [Sphingosinithalassobacter tenebrarum]
MKIILFVAALFVLIFVGVFVVRYRQRWRLQRHEARRHRAYLRSQRSRFLSRFVRGSRTKRLTYRPEEE